MRRKGSLVDPVNNGSNGRNQFTFVMLRGLHISCSRESTDPLLQNTSSITRPGSN